MPVELWPVMQHRMAAYRAQARQVGHDRGARELEARLMDEMRELGASTARDLDDGLPAGQGATGAGTGRRPARCSTTSTWSGEWPSPGATASSRCRYDLPERVIPAEVLAQPTPSRGGRQPRAGPPGRPLPRRRRPPSASRDYYRMPAQADVAAGGRRAGRGGRAGAGHDRRLEAAGYLHRDARLPRRVRARALLSPFDPVVWERERTERLFDFHYRIEIYVPGAQAGARLLRAAVPARRPDRRPGRPEGRPARRDGCVVQGGVRRARRARGHRRGAERGAARPRRVAGARRRSGSSRGATWRRRSVPEPAQPHRPVPPEMAARSTRWVEWQPQSDSHPGVRLSCLPFSTSSSASARARSCASSRRSPRR